MRLQAACEVAAEAGAVVREGAGQALADAGAWQTGQSAPVPKWRPDAGPGRLPRDYPRIVALVREAGTEGIRAVEVHRRLGWPDTDGSRPDVRNRLQRLTQGLAATGEPRGACLGGGRAAARLAPGLRP